MKMQRITLIASLLSFGLFFIGCSKDDDDDDPKEKITATCSDGIQNQNETGVDCGGVCPPCEANSSEFSFKKNGKTANIDQFNANRNTMSNPSSIGLIAVTKEGNKLSISLEETFVGWEDGLSYLSLTPPNMMSYETMVNGAAVIYTSANHNDASAVSFLKLEYKKDGRLKGSFSGELYDGNGNKITISEGGFDTTFDN